MILATAQFTISVISDGLGIQSTTIDYAVSSSGVTPPGNIIVDGEGNPIMSNDGKPLTDGDWTTTLPTVPQGMYLWTRTRLVLTNGTFDMIYNVSYSGENGQQGESAPTPTHTYREFRLSDSSTAMTGSGDGYSWSTTQPKIESGQYLWKREVTEYSDGSTLYSNAYCEVTMSGVLLDVDKNSKAISGKVWASDIKTSIDSYDGSIGKSIKDTVVKTEQTLDGINTTIEEIQSDISEKADGTAVTDLSQKVNTISDTVDSHTQTIESHKTRIEGAEAEIDSTKTIANQTADKFTWLVESGDSASNFTLTNRVAELISPEVVIKDPAGSSTIITGGKIQANAITTAMLATDAIKSTHYEASANVDSPYSAVGTFLDLSNGNFWTQNFGVINATPSGTNIPVGAWFNGTVYANAGRFGQGSSYWNIENITDYNQNEYAGLVTTGPAAYIQAGNWQISNNSTGSHVDNYIATRKYETTQEYSGKLAYYKDTDTNTYYDVGMKIPTDFNGYTQNESEVTTYNRSFFYGRKYTNNNPPELDSQWTYFFRVDNSGNLYLGDKNNDWDVDIYVKGKKLSELYAAIDGSAGGNYVTTKGDNTINGSLTVTNALHATADKAKQLTHALSINGVSFDGSGNSDVDVGTIGVAYGGTGRTEWTQYGILYASATNALSQIGAGTQGQILKSNGSAAPTWIDQSSIVAGSATNATNATNDANGDKIDTTYRKLSDTAFPNGLTGNVTGNVSGSAGSVKNNLIIKLNGGATEGTDLFTYNGGAKKTINITGTLLGLSEASTYGVDTSISSGSTSSNLPTTEAIVNFVEGQNYGVLGVAEGSSNGEISVTTASGTSSVAVHGLGSWAYKSSGSASDVGLGNVTDKKQVEALSSNPTLGNLVAWGSNGYTVADSGLSKSGIVSEISISNDQLTVKTADGNSSSYTINITGQVVSGATVLSDSNGNSISLGSASAPVYFSNGVPAQANTIPTITLNETATTGASFYAPTRAGTSGQYLKSNGTGAPTWATFSKFTVGLENVDNTADDIKNVLSATKFSDARSITLTGDTTGTKSSDGTNGWSIATTTKQLTTLGRITSANIQTNTTQLKKITFAYSSAAMTTAKPTDGNGYILTFAWDNGGYASQFYLNHTKTPHAMIRGATSATIDGVEKSSDWGDWIYLLDANNYNNYSPTLEGTGATGTWDISISGVAATATNAINDSDSNPISTTYAKLSGATFTGAVTGTTITANAIYAGGNSLTSNGIALYGTNCQRYGLAVRSTANRGVHGYVTGDKAEYFFMDDENSGWIYNNYSNNVASISELGNAVFNGSVTIGGNAENNSGMRIEYDENMGCTNFVFY